jgi:hypothetical protein
MRAVIVATTADGLAEVRRDWEADGVQTDLVTNGEEAYRGLSASLPDLVVLDGSLSQTTRLNLHTIVRTRTEAVRPPVIFSRAQTVPDSCAAPDYYLPLDAGTGAIAWLGRCVLGLDLEPEEASPVNGAKAPPGGLVPSPSRNGRSNGLASSPSVAARTTGRRRDRVRASRGGARTGTASRSPGRVGESMSTMQRPGGTRRPARGRSDVSLTGFALRWWWLVLVMIALGAVGGYGFLQYGPLPYHSTATLMLQPQSEASGVPVISTNPQRSTVSTLALAGMAASPTVYTATSETLLGQLEITSDELANLVLIGKIEITPVGASNFITITATDTDPQRAWLLADGYSRGFVRDLTVQSRLVSEQQAVTLRSQLAVLQQQLASVPLTFNNPGTVDTYSAVHARILQVMLDTQAKLEATQQATSPVIRYGETTAPIVAVNEKRVLIAGAAVGGVLGVVVAYLAELLRLWRRRKPSGQPRSARVEERPAEPAPAPGGGLLDGHPQPALQYQKEGQPRWAGSARV